jgi:hyperosmotically inducible periplasmic protein
MKTTATFTPKIVSASVSLLLAATLASFAGLAATQSEGPAEKAGQQIDQTADKAAQAASDAKESASEKAEATGEYMDDSAITAKVKLAILRDPDLKVFQISVTTTGGVVTLSGAVDSQQSIDRASAVARDTRNVKSVENNLTVKDAN